MAHSPRRQLLTLAALVAAVNLGGAWPGFAEDGGHGHGGDDHGGPSVPGVPVGGGGASPGGVIGGGLAGGVGGPGGLGGGSRLGGGGGGGGGGLSPLSPNAFGGEDSFRRHHGDDDGGGDSGPGFSLSPGRSLSDTGPGGGLNLRRDVSNGRDAEDIGRSLGERASEAAKELRDEAKDGRGKLSEDAEDLAGKKADEALSDTSLLTESRQRQARDLLQFHRDVVEPDDHGQPVVRGQILALSPSAEALSRAERAGFRVREVETLAELGVRNVVLVGPRGVSAVEALRRLRALDPKGQYDFNHLYQESGVVRAHAAAPPPVTDGAVGRGVRVGLVDGGVAPSQPTLAGAKVVQRGFAPGGLHASPHATAVASLIAGRSGRFRGAAPGATLLVADVYGTTPTGGSADAIARGLAWLAQSGAPVINISLVGPPNILLEAAVKALIARGHIVVAAVGNDGPAAPPLYPASYPGVVAVTGVDLRRRVLPEAGRGTHVDFAAPGSDMAAAGLDGGFVSVRGTSFAAPLAAGLLARQLTAPSAVGAGRAIAALSRQALDLGPRGPDPIYGRGLVASELRVVPSAVQARVALRGP